MITAVRVDHRLLHGQVAFTWVKSTGSNCILIANDDVAKDKLRMSALRMAAPSNTKMVIKSIDDSIDAILSGSTDKYQLFIITESIKDANELSKKIDSIKSINIGGVKAEDGKKQISKAVFVSEEESSLIREMNDRGIHVEIRMVPDDASLKAIDLI